MSLYRTENPPGRFWTPYPLSPEQMAALEAEVAEEVEAAEDIKTILVGGQPIQVEILGSRRIVQGQARANERSQIVGFQQGRRSITIVNQGAVNIYVGDGNVSPSQGGASNNGFLLAIGAGLSLDTQAEIYAIPATASTLWIVHYIAEFRD